MDCVYSRPDSRPCPLGNETKEADSYSDLESGDNKGRTDSSAGLGLNPTPICGVDSIEAERAPNFDSWPRLSQSTKGPPQGLHGRLSDLDLLHHYLSHTSKTLAAASNDSVKQEAWQVKIPRLALEYEGVSHALRALSALHLVSEILRFGKCCIGDSGSDLTDILKSRAESCYGQSLRILGADVASFDSTKTDSILAASSLLFLFNTAHAACIVAQQANQERCGARETSQHNDAAQTSRLPSWVHFITGITTIREPPVRKTKAASDLDGLLDDNGIVVVPEDVASRQDADAEFLAQVDALQRPSVYSHRMFSVVAKTRLNAFETLQTLLCNQRSRLRDADTDSCCDALQKLIRRTSLVFTWEDSSTGSISTPRLYNRNPVRTIFSWLGLLDDNFVDLLEAGDIRALVIYAHYLTVFLLMEDVWFVGGIGRQEIERNIMAIHEYEQHEKLQVDDTELRVKFNWKTAMIWPTEMARLSIQALH